jgi:hypothetical protein
MEKLAVWINVLRLATNRLALGIRDAELPRIFLNAKVQLRRLDDNAVFVGFFSTTQLQ